ncbi:unnamed protein product, partial [Allacma fusca]
VLVTYRLYSCLGTEHTGGFNLGKILKLVLSCCLGLRTSVAEEELSKVFRYVSWWIAHSEGSINDKMY